MALEREFSEKSSNKLFYSVDTEGRLFRKATPDDIAKNKSIVDHIKTKGTRAGEIEKRKVVQSLFGYPTALWVKTSEEFGEFLVTELYENGETAVIECPLTSSFADDIMRKCSNMKAGNKYEFSSWKMQATDKVTKKPIPEKFIRGMSIKDEVGNKIERYITREIELKLVPLGKAPFYNPDVEYQSKDFYQVYYKMLRSEFKSRVIPKSHTAFAEWLEENKVYIAPLLKATSDDDDSEDMFLQLEGSEPAISEDPTLTDDLPNWI